MRRLWGNWRWDARYAGRRCSRDILRWVRFLRRFFCTTTVFGSTTGAAITAPPPESEIPPSFPIDIVGEKVGVGVGVEAGLMSPGENREKLGSVDVAQYIAVVAVVELSESFRTEALCGLSWILKSRMLSVP
ncbi:MAG: hypothetical protein WCF90_05045 [Methanomicrobiales archaeon]